MSELRKELRIGNLLMYSDNSEIWEVSGIHEFGIDCFDDVEETYMEYENFEPIALTEEWLLNFGFKKKSYFTQGIIIECVYYQLGIFVVYLLPNSFEVEIITKSGDQFNLFKNWNYVHELQNIYFIFENKELTHQKIN